MSPKQKNFVLLGGFLGFLWLAYIFSFSKALGLKQEVKRLQTETELYQNVAVKINRFTRENEYYDSILQHKKLSINSSFQNSLLAYLSAFTDSTTVKIIEFKAPHQVEIDNSKTNTYQFSVSGTFEEVLRLIYALEQTYKLGKIVSVEFSKSKNFRTRKISLVAKLLLEQVEVK